MNLLMTHENKNKKIDVIEGEDLERLKMYPNESFRRVMNPLAWYIEEGCDGVRYRVKGFTIGELETYDIYHVQHILSKGREQGLVSLQYGKAARTKYPNFEDYLKAQELEGLKAALKYWNERLQMQKMAVNEKKQQKTSDLPTALEKQKTFETMISSIETWVKDAGSEMTTTPTETISLERPKKEATEDKMDLKVTPSGRYMLNGKWITKEKYEELSKEQ